MKRFVATIAAVLALLIPEYAHAQAYGGTGKVGFGLNEYGRVQLYVPTSNDTIELERAAVLAALDSNNVFDYEQDAENVSGPDLWTGGIADTMASVLTDNTYSGAPPDIKVLVTVYAWKNDEFFLAKYTITNYSSGTYTLYLGIGMVIELSGAYGSETASYDATKKMAYYFRGSEPAFIGVKVMGQDPYSFHVLDWTVYSPGSSSDHATDSTRWRMTALPGFDSPLTGGPVDGTFSNLNAGPRTIAAGDSVSFVMSYMFSTSLSGLQTVADGAVARYASVFPASVKRTSQLIPERSMLLQNYPNPFNPNTLIEFQLKESAQTKLTVYDMLGREVETLVNDRLNAGTYQVNFTAGGLASGYYYYRLVSGAYSETRRMILVK
jgi:hypothetical protein